MKFDHIALLALVFVLGFFVSQVISSVGLVSGEPVQSPERLSPADRISENQIHVYDDEIIINVSHAQWASFTDTNSMDPFLDQGANALQFIPNSPDDINIGDIISYVPAGADEDQSIIHRVVYSGEDEKGIYYIVKGDNNVVADPGKVYFSQIRRVLFAVIW